MREACLCISNAMLTMPYSRIPVPMKVRMLSYTAIPGTGGHRRLGPTCGPDHAGTLVYCICHLVSLTGVLILVPLYYISLGPPTSTLGLDLTETIPAHVPLLAGCR